jgi:hypothetical protein
MLGKEDIKYQVSSALQYLSKSGSQNLDFWLDSKDFMIADRRIIKKTIETKKVVTNARRLGLPFV